MRSTLAKCNFSTVFRRRATLRPFTVRQMATQQMQQSGPMELVIRTKLSEALAPTKLEVHNDSETSRIALTRIY